ncbi:hypothetical protein [Nocardia ignorata]|uniref:Uncharacterized protein n=1 Tax=Nocardia ignorata TaxID=145285 RepID=A0A4R6P0M6_NOCIG|nr:hypothetical protein [Nocardia ignorata]TDP29822.1 hypothetical protein DFR75_11290 [Nocardia ignorata]
MSGNEISVYIAAVDPDDARALLAEALAVASEGNGHDGTLIRATRDGGFAQLYTHLP